MAEQTHYLLTPKNIYRLLTGRLSGLFSYVFPEERLRGMTLVRFWREQLAPLVSAETLEALVPLDGTHPRVQSNMMNRSGSNVSRLLRTELDSRLNAATMSRLIRRNMRFLTQRSYRADLFANYLTDFEDLCFRDDFFIRPVVREYLLSLRAWRPADNPGKRQSPRLFHDACRLSWLCVFSLYGQMMSCAALAQRCLDASLLPDALWRLLNSEAAPEEWTVLSASDGLLLCPPAECYVTAAPTPQQLADHLREKHRVLVTGIGGAGKTELVRQALPRLGVWYDRAAFVQYEGSLTQSLRRAFPDLQAQDDEALLRAVKEALEEDAPHTLLLVDNLGGSSVTAEEAGYLCSLASDVLATGRLTSLTGFHALPMVDLTEEGAVRLFLETSGLREEAVQAEAVRQIASVTGGHPLTLTILGHVCRANYWLPKDILCRLDQRRMDELAYVEGARVIGLSASLQTLFDLGVLSGNEQKLLRLLSLFPCVSWTAERLSPLAGDIPQETVPLSLQLQILADQSWLIPGNAGYLLHPALAETIRLTPCRCEEHPLLWRRWAGYLQPPMDAKKKAESELALSAVLRCQDGLNEDGLQVLTVLEMAAMSLHPGVIRCRLPDLHRRYLDTHPHGDAQDIELHIIHMLWALLGSEEDDYTRSARELMKLPPCLLKETPYYDELLNVLEVGAARLDPGEADALFEMLRPEVDQEEKLIVYYNFLGGKQRHVDKAPRAALESLERARTLIEKHGLQGSVAEAANDTRMAYACADLQQWMQAASLMRRVMANLSGRGYDEQSQTMVNTRNSYLFFLGRCTERQQALAELTTSVEEMENSAGTSPEEMANALNNLALLEMEDGHPEEAARSSEKACALIRDNAEISHVIRISVFLGAAEVLHACSHDERAFAMVGAAQTLCDAYYGRESATAWRCRAWNAVILSSLGYAEEAECQRKQALAALPALPGEEAEQIRRILNLPDRPAPIA